MATLLIHGGTVIDGTGSAGVRADVLIRDGRIAAVSPDLQADGAKLIDASGAYVTPGFIDSHTHFDPSVFWDSLVEMAQHGVTTVLIGNCSLGLAPLHATDKDAVADLFAFIEDIPREVFSSLVPWNWETYTDYVATMQTRRFATNVASLVSHSMLRQYVMRGAAWERAADEIEVQRIATELDAALQAGAIGMSTSFFDRDSKGHKVPSFYSNDAEFDALFAVLGKYRAMFQIIPSHPDTLAVVAELERIGAFARRHDVPIVSNAIGDMPSLPENSPALLACARKLRADGVRIYHMLSPRSIELVINPDQTIAFMVMPVWNEMIQANRARKRLLLEDSQWRLGARAEWDTVDSFLFPTKAPELIRIVAVGRPELETWIGRSLGDVIAARDGHPSDVLADWLLENEFDTRFVYPITNLDPEKVGELARQPEILISGSDAGAHFQMFCGVGDTTLLLTRHVRDRGDLKLAKAIQMLTADQAQLLGLIDRGVIRPGAVADLTVFALDELQWEREIVVRDIPGGMPRFARPAGNFRYTIVSGEVVQATGVDTGARPAEFLGAGAANRPSHAHGVNSYPSPRNTAPL